jgi:hypothetical protein
MLAFFAVTAVTKFSSDGSFLQLSCHPAVAMAMQYTQTNRDHR